MGSRRPLIVALVAAAALAACGGGGSSAKANPVERALDTLERLKDRGCACQDAACFQPVQAEMDAWAKANAVNLAGATATREQATRARAIDLAMAECQERFGVFTEAYRLADTLLAELRAYKERYCACTTAGCIDQIELAMRGWRAARRDEVQRLRPTKKQ
ncbi:MAG: hypothetical protein F9K40_04040, partial [Kofleriaceae bacterium]